jgi:hypothetical protein
MNMTNPELQTAEELVTHTNCNIFLTGKAGTGKTTFLQAIQKKTPKRLVVTAPTGVAAINAGGVTLHSFFQLPFGPFLPGTEVHAGRHRLRREKKNLIRSLDLLIIDEISMVRADLLDGVDNILRRYRLMESPFGGVQLLMIGDLHQLSPVVKPAEWQVLQSNYDSPYFFSSSALQRADLMTLELKHIYRQSDPHFIELLNRVRNNRLDSATLQRLNSRHIPDFSPRDGEGYITLCTHNKGADAINQDKLRALSGKPRYYHAELNGEFPESIYPAPAALEVKIGAQVMFLRNDMSPEKSYFNGKIGKITAMTRDAIEVNCPEDSDTIRVAPTTWENIEYTVDPKTAEIHPKVIGTFSQYPLKPAWAITIHKSQGLTFDKAIIDARAAFAYGQVYVALSRCRSFEGIVLSSALNTPAVKSDPAIKRFLTETANNQPSLEKVARAKRLYRQQLMLACFSFEKLGQIFERLAILIGDSGGLVQVLEGGDILDFQRWTAAEICAIGEKFKRQLQGMFADDDRPEDHTAVQERIIRACAYFEGKFTARFCPWLTTFDVETDNGELRRKIGDTVKQLRRETALKLAALRSCREGFSPERYLRAISVAAMDVGPASSQAPAVTIQVDVEHAELFDALRQWRKRKAAEEGLPHFQVMHQKVLAQIALNRPDSISALRKIKGIGKRLAQRYGQELTALVADYVGRHGMNVVSSSGPAPRITSRVRQKKKIA